MLNTIVGAGILVFVCWCLITLYRHASKEGRNKTLLEIHDLHDKTIKAHTEKLDKSLDNLSQLKSKLSTLPEGDFNATKLPKAKKTRRS